MDFMLGVCVAGHSAMAIVNFHYFEFPLEVITNNKIRLG
jgi:hypothetical protein